MAHLFKVPSKVARKALAKVAKRAFKVGRKVFAG